MTQQHFATPSTPNADMRPCSPPLAFWTFLVCKCQDLGKRECWWRAPPLLLREIIFLGNQRCCRDHPLQRSGSSFVAKNLWSQGSFFSCKVPFQHFPPRHQSTGFTLLTFTSRLPMAIFATESNSSSCGSSEWLWWGFLICDKKGYFLVIQTSAKLTKN